MDKSQDDSWWDKFVLLYMVNLGEGLIHNLHQKCKDCTIKNLILKEHFIILKLIQNELTTIS